MMDFLLPKGNIGDDPNTSPGGWENVRQKAKEYWDYIYQLTEQGNLYERFRELIRRDDIDNHVNNYVIDEARGFVSRYNAQAFYCASPMSSVNNRKAFPNIFKFDEYAMVCYLSHGRHSLNALIPHKLEFCRSRDLFKTSEILPVKCINDGGTMREINELLDGFFVNQPTMVQAGGKIWMMIPTFNLTTNPPTLGSQWDTYKTFITHSGDYGTTWSELIEIHDDAIVPSSKPIVVGNEIWFTGYNTGNVALGMTITDLASYIVKFNYNTLIASAPIKIDADWTNLYTTEPAVIEYASGKFMCVARVNYNSNFPGAESANKGVVIAYSTDGIDWGDYEFINWGGSYPNQPKLFMYKGHVYFANVNALYHGKPSADLSGIEWIERNASPDWRTKHGYVMMTYEAALGGALYRGDPRTGTLGNQVTLTRVGGADFVVWDEDKEIILSVIGFHNDQSGVYLAEPWVNIIKRNSVKADFSLTERLIYSTEISGSLPWITIHNSYALLGNEIKVQWADRANDNISLNAEILSDAKVKFTAGQVMTNAKIVYEIFKS